MRSEISRCFQCLDDAKEEMIRVEELSRARDEMKKEGKVSGDWKCCFKMRQSGSYC